MPRTKGKNQGRPGNNTSRDAGYNFDPLDKASMKNDRFDAYYKAQRIIPDDEWDKFMDTLREPLPTTFRVAGSRQAAHALNDIIKSTYIPHLQHATFEDELIAPPNQIPWYPDKFAWQFNVSKRVLRKNPEFKKFHSFLVYETEVGNISRQEAVSMLPPLFLQVEPHHRVIDMCAAPGSKTAQLLEALHANDAVNLSSIPPGLLIANDTDAKRTHLLIHQSARLPSPAFMVTNLDATNYPTIQIPAEHDASIRVSQKQQSLLFDRILCDVPCSGDGTMRKNLEIWKRWQPLDGNGLHSLQLRILQRAMRLLQSGGRIVYSTCSLNPVENEAVIAAALNSTPGFTLVDASSMLPELIRRPGMTIWRPPSDRNLSFFDSLDDYVNSLPGEKQKQSHKMLRSYWPPDNVDELNLTRCMRIYPHHQDTGGFFVAILEKIRRPISTNQISKEGKRSAESTDDPIDSKKPRLMTDDVHNTASGPLAETSDPGTTNEGIVINESAVDDDEQIYVDDQRQSTSSGRAGIKSSNGGGGTFKEPPFTYLPPDDPTLVSCLEKLNIDSSFPSHNVLIRNPAGEPARSLYLTNDIVKKIIDNNDYVRLRLVTSGTKVFGRQEGKGAEMSFRVLGEGLPAVLPFIPPEVILPGDLQSLKTLMKGYYPLLTSFPEHFRSIVEAKPFGNHIVRLPAGSWDGVTLSHDLVVPVWKSNVSLGLMIDKKTKSALSLRLFGEDITSVGQEAAAKKKGAQAAPAASTSTEELPDATPIVEETD